MNIKENINKEESELISLLRQHSPQAMEMLYDHFSPMLYGIIWRIVKNEKEAEEILTKTFVHIWQNSSAFDESKQSLCVWMIGFARGFAHEKISFKTFLQNQEILSYVDIERNKDEPDNKIKIDLFEDKSALMTAEQRLILNLIFLGGGNMIEVAIHLGITEEQVKQLLREALNHYRKQLQQAS